MTSPHRIDVHHHILPPRYLKAVGEEAIGRLLVSGKAPAWSPDLSIAVMDRHGIARAYTSMSAPGVSGCAEAEAVEVVRGFNDDAAALRRSSAGRFGTFAFLPLPHVSAALAEIDRVYDTIGTDGIGLLTSYGQRYLGDPLFDPVFVALDRRRAVVFVHPDCGPCSCHIPGVPAATLDFPFDTTRAIVSLMMNGTFARFPGIRFIFSHAGGTVPFLADRLARLERIPSNRAMLSEGVLPTLRRLYFDTALSANRFAFASLLQLVDASRVLFGSDYPFAPEDTTAATVAGLAALGLDAAQLHAIERGNALAMFNAPT